ncbi:ribonuclease H-like domain-containing protein [Tanacetum coccineum]
MMKIMINEESSDTSISDYEEDDLNIVENNFSSNSSETEECECIGNCTCDYKEINANDDSDDVKINAQGSSSTAFVSQEDGGFDWSSHADDVVQNQALMAETSSAADDLPAEVKAYIKNEKQYQDDLAFAKWEKEELLLKVEKLENDLENAKRESDQVKLDVEKFQNSSKKLDNLISVQIHDKLKTGLCYKQVPPPYNNIYILPTKEVVFKCKNEEISLEAPKIDPSEPSTSKIPAKTNECESEKPHNDDESHGFYDLMRVSRKVIKHQQYLLRHAVNAYAAAVTSDAARIVTKYSSHDVIDFNTFKLTQGKPLKKKNIWHVDSGCSRHMTGNLSCLQNFENFDGGYIAFGGYSKGGKISGKGMVSNGKLNFHDVFYVEQLKYNLLSVSQVCDRKNKILFTECIILAPDFKITDEKQVLLRTPRNENVYCLDMASASPQKEVNCFISKASVNESDLWNRRLYHMNFKTMNKLVKQNLVKGLPRKEFFKDDHCIACLKGKQHKTSHKSKEMPSYLLPSGQKLLILPAYVHNRILVIKPQMKTPYEHFHKRKPLISFLKPFGCPCTILNSKDHLGKFDSKVHEGFFVGYSTQSKAYRVYNKVTRIIKESANVTFNENTSNAPGTGPDWLFDIDAFTNSSSAEKFAGHREVQIEQHEKESQPIYVYYPIVSVDPPEFSEASTTTEKEAPKDSEKETKNNAGYDDGFHEVETEVQQQHHHVDQELEVQTNEDQPEENYSNLDVTIQEELHPSTRV